VRICPGCGRQVQAGLPRKPSMDAAMD